MSLSSVNKPSTRRSSLLFQTSQNIDLILTPSKPPLSEAKLKSSLVKAEEISKSVAEKSKNLCLSELSLLKKSGPPNGLANLKIHEFNYLINYVIYLVSNQQIQEAVDHLAEDRRAKKEEIGKNEKLLKDHSEKLENLRERVDSLQGSVESCEKQIRNLNSTLELASSSQAEDLQLAVERVTMEMIVKLNETADEFRNLISASKVEHVTVDVQTNEELEEVLDVVDNSELDLSVPMLEPDTQTSLALEAEAAREAEEAFWKLEKATNTRQRSETVDYLRSIVVELAEDAIDPDVVEAAAQIRAEVSRVPVEEVGPAVGGARKKMNRISKKVSFEDPASNGEEAVPQMEKAEVEQFELLDYNDYPDEDFPERYDNHFAVVYSGIKIPATVKKIKTVYKLERKFATEMTQSIYPQFHPSCIKAIKSLRPPTRPRTEAYSIKVTFNSEHVRQHILSAACHAHLLVRPCISGKKLAQLKEDQQERYSVQGTSTPGPAFLAYGGAASLKRMHPSTEASMKLWNEEYQRRKKYSREVVIGGRHRRNMTTLTVNAPINLDSQKWASRLNKEYNRLVMTQSVRAFFDGVRQQDQRGSESMDAARTAETATWASNGRTTRPSTRTPYRHRGRNDYQGRRSWQDQL